MYRDINEIKLFRITHIDNIPHILRYGIVHNNSYSRNPDFVSIGDVSLIDFRATCKRRVNAGPEIVLGDYIPFYFGVRMPMLFVIQRGGNCVKQPRRAEDIVYIAVSVQKIMEHGNRFYFSDGHGTDSITEFYGSDRITDLLNIVDWNAVKTRKWSGDGVETDLKRRKQAEFLIEGDIAPDCIIRYGCYNEDVKARLVNVGVSEDMISVIPQAYY